MYRNKTFNRKKVMIVFVAVFFIMMFLIGRLVYLMIFCSEYYGNKAENLHERERDIKAARGKLLDANGTVLATNKSVCTISVIHNQMEEPEKVIAMLVKELGISEETARKRVEKVSSIERVKTNVAKETGDAIRAYGLSGVKVDEDYKRYYPYGTLASKVLGFTGADNQGILGLEVKYDEYLQGTNGKILTLTDARGIEIENAGESRLEPVNGYDLCLSLDYNIQMYCEQAAKKVCTKKSADSVSVIVMNPQNGELMAMVNYPEFDLNNPFTLAGDTGEAVSAEEKQNLLNKMWRNQCISDTYEPGSTFKILSTIAGMSEGVIDDGTYINCTGSFDLVTPPINCWNKQGHGEIEIREAIEQSCNYYFNMVGFKLGQDADGNFSENRSLSVLQKYASEIGLDKKTGIEITESAPHVSDSYAVPSYIGQGTNAYTTSQLARYATAIATSGNVYDLTLLDRQTDSKGNTLKKYEPDIINTVDVSQNVWDDIHDGMYRVVQTHRQFDGLGVDVAGKTGTAEVTVYHPNHGLFMGYAPASDPEYAIAVRIENGYTSGNACLAADDIFKYIFELTDEKSILTGVAASDTSDTSND